MAPHLKPEPAPQRRNTASPSPGVHIHEIALSLLVRSDRPAFQRAGVAPCARRTSRGRCRQAVISSHPVRALPGQLDAVLMVNDNNPELIKE